MQALNAVTTPHVDLAKRLSQMPVRQTKAEGSASDEDDEEVEGMSDAEEPPAVGSTQDQTRWTPQKEAKVKKTQVSHKEVNEKEASGNSPGKQLGEAKDSMFMHQKHFDFHGTPLDDDEAAAAMAGLSDADSPLAADCGGINTAATQGERCASAPATALCFTPHPLGENLLCFGRKLDLVVCAGSLAVAYAYMEVHCNVHTVGTDTSTQETVSVLSCGRHHISNLTLPRRACH
jgi:hypothetical protein